MSTRAGSTAKISVSLPATDLASLKRRAKRLYDGNVSAVISELAADAALLEAMHDLVDRLGGPLLEDKERAALDREWRRRAAARPHARKRAR